LLDGNIYCNKEAVPGRTTNQRLDGKLDITTG